MFKKIKKTIALLKKLETHCKDIETLRTTAFLNGYGISKERSLSTTPDLMLSIENSHENETCFIIGTGRSLKNVDLSVLNGKTTFTVNRGFLLKNQGLDSVSYYLISDPQAVEDYGRDIPLDFIKDKIFASSHSGWSSAADNLVVYNLYDQPRVFDGFFQTDPLRPLYPGNTVVIEAIQIAAMMGFRRICLLGIDLDFSHNGEGAHFYPGTNGEKARSTRISLSAADSMRRSLQFADIYLKKRGIHLINASPNTNPAGLEQKTIEELL